MGALHHILCIGQSNAPGSASQPALSTTPSSTHKMLSRLAFNAGTTCGIRTSMNSLNVVGDYTGIVALAESDITANTGNLTNNQYNGSNASVDGPYGETSGFAMTAYVSRVKPGTTCLWSVACRGGAEYAKVAKGGDIYANGMVRVNAAQALYAAAGFSSHKVLAIVVEHGESDFNNVNYAANLITWLTDWTTDIKAATGQTENPIFILLQVSHDTDRTSAVQQLLASRLNSRIYVASPAYFAAHSADHRTGPGHRQLANYLGRVYQRVVIEGREWTGLRPRSVTLDGAYIHVKFEVPAPPLVWDTTIVAAQTTNGFEYSDDSSSATLSSVAINGTDEVVCTLSGAPAPGSNPRLKYATTQQVGGNLRDSESELGVNGETTYNWCQHFNEIATSASAKTFSPPAKGAS